MKLSLLHKMKSVKIKVKKKSSHEGETPLGGGMKSLEMITRL